MDFNKMDFNKMDFNNTVFKVDVNNTQTRCPLVIMLDTSGSMGGYPEEQVKIGLRELVKNLKQHEIAAYSVDLAVYHYNDYVSVVMPFTTVCDIDEEKLISNIPKADGCTNMASAVEVCYSALQKIQEVYKDNGISQYISHMVIMSDGCPDSYSELEEEAQIVRDLEEDKRLVSIPLAVEGADKKVMDSLSINGSQSIENANIVDFFKFLSASMSSFSTTGKTVLDNSEVLSAWADL